MNDYRLTPLYMRFTARKREIIELVCRGMSNEAVGERLYIESSTVATHLTEIYDEMATWDDCAHTKPNRLLLISIFAPFFDRNPHLSSESLRNRN